MLFPITLDIDECSAEASPCDENADCTNTDGSYICNCKQGFDGDGEVCEGKTVPSSIDMFFVEENQSKSNQILIIFVCASSDFDECSLEPSPCDENATCSNTDGSFSCTCRPGFSGNGSFCKGMK